VRLDLRTVALLISVLFSVIALLHVSAQTTGFSDASIKSIQLVPPLVGVDNTFSMYITIEVHSSARGLRAVVAAETAGLEIIKGNEAQLLAEPVDSIPIHTQSTLGGDVHGSSRTLCMYSTALLQSR